MKLLVSALEPSSNLHLKEVLKHTKDIEIVGIFEKSLGTPLYDTSSIAVMGVVDAVRKIRWAFRAIDSLVLLAKDVDKILLMDSSAFNLPLAKRLKAAYPDKEIIYYILPQIWASRPKRAKRLEAYCDRLLGILPFETAYYSEGRAEYVGHPLLDEIKSSQSQERDAIAYMPGSRRSEISRLLPIFREVQSRLNHKRSLLIIPSGFTPEKVDLLYGDISMFEVHRDTHSALAESEFAFICSGTATLEAALIGTPFTLAYIAKKIDFFIGTKLFGITQVGLANIILSKHNQTTLHREFLQESVTADNLLDEYRTFDRNLFAEKAEALRTYLRWGSSKNVANIIMEPSSSGLL